MNSPLVSVLTATYNRSHVLPHALDSVRGQTYHPIEHIIIDDGSTDGTKTLITSRHDEPRVRQQAKLLGVKIIPKVLATIVPIEF